MNQPPPLKCELDRGGEHIKAVFHASAEIDRRGFLEILGRTGNFTDLKSKVHALREHLVVEDEVVGVLEQGQFSQDFAAECTITGVVLGELDSEEIDFQKRSAAGWKCTCREAFRPVMRARR